MDAGCAPYCSLGSSRAGSETLTPAPPGFVSSLKRQILPSSPEAKTRYGVGSSSEAQAVESCPSCTGPCCRNSQFPHRTDSSTGARLQAEVDCTSGSAPGSCHLTHSPISPAPRIKGALIQSQGGCRQAATMPQESSGLQPASLDLLCTSGWPPSQKEGPGPPCPQGHSHFSKGYPGPTQSSQQARDRDAPAQQWALVHLAQRPAPALLSSIPVFFYSALVSAPLAG